MIDIIKNAFELTKKNALILIGMVITLIIISMIFSFITSAFVSVPIVGTLLNIVSFVIQIYFGVALIKLGLLIVDGKEPEFNDIKPKFQEMIKYLMASLMLAIIFFIVFLITIGVLGMLGVIKSGLNTLFLDIMTHPENIVNYTKEELSYAFIVLFLMAIPAALLYIRLQFANYIVIDKGTQASLAIFESYKITKGYLLYIVLAYILIIILNIIGALLFFVGLIFTIPMSFMMIILLYRSFDHAASIEDKTSSKIE